MSGKDLLVDLGNISQKYYDEAENETIEKASGYRTLKKPLLIAAIVALMLLMMGCAVVYVLRMQDMSIGKETYTQTFDDQGKYLEEPVEKTADVLTLYGHSGDNIQKATAEWFAFLETYDPEGKLMDNDPDHSDIPNQFEYTYGCYTQDMVSKVQQIAAKYDLKLLEEWLPFQAWQSDIFLEETGITSLVLPDSGAEVERLSGMFYPPYNFDVDISLRSERLPNELWVTVLYAHRDYFPRDYPGGTDLSTYEQWDYAAPDGTQLLLALNNKGHGYVFAQLEEAVMILSIDGNYSTSAYPTAEQIMSKEELETAASMIDWSIRPQILDRNAVAQKLAESQAEYDAVHTYAPETFGSFADVLLARYSVPNELARYAFYDITGDGMEELLIDLAGNGGIDEWYTVVDGEVLFMMGNENFLCEGNILEYYYEDPERGDFHSYHWYRTPEAENAWMDLDPETTGDSIVFVGKLRGQWVQAQDKHGEETEITEAKAQEILSQYPRIPLNWTSVLEYPISEEQTLGEYFEEKDVRVSQEELREIYKEYLQNLKSMHYSHYRILDINGDGVKDLLLKGEDSAIMGNTDFYWVALTYRYGTVEGFASDFYLCENNVLEHVDTRHAGGIGVEKDGHQFLHYQGFREEQLDFVVYNKSTASWQTDWWDEQPITEQEAKDILARYPRIDQGMRPISELLE